MLYRRWVGGWVDGWEDWVDDVLVCLLSAAHATIGRARRLSSALSLFPYGLYLLVALLEDPVPDLGHLTVELALVFGEGLRV